jgi:hypothetical protein
MSLGNMRTNGVRSLLLGDTGHRLPARIAPGRRLGRASGAASGHCGDTVTAKGQDPPPTEGIAANMREGLAITH